MEVILKEDVVGLGYKDDIVTVKNGYGRNFLIPTGKAIIATEAAKSALIRSLPLRRKQRNARRSTRVSASPSQPTPTWLQAVSMDPLQELRSLLS